MVHTKNSTLGCDYTCGVSFLSRQDEHKRCGMWHVNDLGDYVDLLYLIIAVHNILRKGVRDPTVSNMFILYSGSYVALFRGQYSPCTAITRYMRVTEPFPDGDLPIVAQTKYTLLKHILYKYAGMENKPLSET